MNISKIEKVSELKQVLIQKKQLEKLIDELDIRKNALLDELKDEVLQVFDRDSTIKDTYTYNGVKIQRQYRQTVVLKKDKQEEALSAGLAERKSVVIFMAQLLPERHD